MSHRFRPAALAALLLALGLSSAAAQNRTTDRAGLLVTPQWLRAHLAEPGLVILQVGQPATYAREHIAGARFVRLQDVSAPRDSTRPDLEMPEDDSLRADLERLGIGDNSRIVVVFSDEWMSPSTRVIFTLAYAGLAERASLLDGGLVAWKDAGFPVTADVPGPARGRVTLHVNRDLIVDHAYVQALRAGPHIRLIDARDSVFYAGPSRGDMPSGHIAGAVSLPFTTMANDSDVFYPRAELERRFQAAGVQPGDTVIAYCHIGQQATMLLFGARLTGHPVRLYDGSMHDWLERHLPIEGGR
jgi:thiosulfate/3-mercaptopyruvate sulfurtransferase